MPNIQLDAVATIQVGYQSKERINENAIGSHMLIQGKDFDSQNQLNAKSLARFFPERRPGLYSVLRDDILFMARGSRNFAFYIDRELPDTLVSGSFCIVRVKVESILPAYLAWWLNQPPAQDYFREASAGGTIAFVSKGALSGLRVEIPPRAIQEQIVRIMALWIHERSIRNALAEQRERLIKSITIHAIEGKE